MKYTSLFVVAALVANTSAMRIKESVAATTEFAPPAKGPYASDTDHLSNECYGADEDDIMYDVFERYRVEEKNPLGAGMGIFKLPKWSGPQWSRDIISKMHVMDEDKVDAYAWRPLPHSIAGIEMDLNSRFLWVGSEKVVRSF